MNKPQPYLYWLIPDDPEDPLLKDALLALVQCGHMFFWTDRLTGIAPDGVLKAVRERITRTYDTSMAIADQPC